MGIEKYVSPLLLRKYEFWNYEHAIEILNEAFPEEWGEIKEALEKLVITVDDIKEKGGNESPIPLKFDKVLFPYGWREIRITGDLLIKKYPRAANAKRGKFEKLPSDQMTLEGYIDGHNIDFVKNKVAFDLEWNSKDQTFDRDLLAMRTYYDCRLIDVGIIVTRSKELNEVFAQIPDGDNGNIKHKYGASTTWMGKLKYRLDSRRNGACPILAIGIKKECIEGI